MFSQRRRLSASLGLCLCAASALTSGCLVKVITLSSDDGGPRNPAGDASMTSDAALPPPVDAPLPPPVDVPIMPTDVPAPPPVDVPPSGAGSVDLLVVVDNSFSMTHGQQYLNSYLSNTVGILFARHGVSDVHLGVVTTDLGTPGSTVPGCAVSDGGDQGIMNPRVRGPATLTRAANLPNVADRIFCTPDVINAPFTTLRATDNAMFLVHAPSCHAEVGLGGCGLEQQLEAAYRALVTGARPGGPNAGFLRSEATLAILVVSDEDDGSVRDCRYHDGTGACSDAVDVYNAPSARWASPDLNLRLYNYTPGSAQDPTWSLDRYVDPARPARGFLGLKPGHPERVVFGAITGVPLDVPRRADGGTDWDTLLGPPASGRPDDFITRNGQSAFIDPMNPSGPTSMRQLDPDPLCSTRMVPACRLRNSAPSTACDVSSQYYAWRARRIAEVARRFDQSALCNGQPCRNGMVASICEVGDSTPFATFADLIARRVTR